MKHRALIVDDEKHARENLSGMLASHCPNIRVIGEATDPESAEKLIREQKPDLLFLDIRLSKGTGFDLLGKLKTRNFGVIFVTAFDSYAIKAIKFSAVDYLLKPLHHKELINAVKKFSDEAKSARRSTQLELLIENLSKERAFSRLGVYTEDRIELLVVKQIIRLQGESNYTRIFLEDGKRVLVSKTLVEFEELLHDLGFIRVHKTHLVNLDRIQSIKKNGDVTLLLTEGSVVPVSRRRKAAVIERVKLYLHS